MKYKLNDAFTAQNLAVNTPIAPRPLLGPEIGPDPRNHNNPISMVSVPIFSGDNGILYDFNFGYRIKFPTDRNITTYRLIIRDRKQNSLLSDTTHAPGETVIGERKYYIQYHIEVWDNDTSEKLFEHDFNCQNRKVCIIVPDGGLGDNLAWLPYVDEFRKFHKAQVVCYLGEWLIRIIRDQYPKITFVPIKEKRIIDDTYACFYCAIFPKERNSWRPVAHQHLGMQKSVAMALGLPLKEIRTKLKLDAPRPFPEPYVCISAMATSPTKYWNYPGGWDEIVRWLKSLGYRVLCIDRDSELTFNAQHFQIPSEAEDWTGAKPITERIAVLQHADFFIGLPSGLSWLAWCCKVPVVMISGFSLANCEFSTPYRVTNFHFCHGCWNDTDAFFDSDCNIWCPHHGGTKREIECTKTITPEMVRSEIEKIPNLLKSKS